MKKGMPTIAIVLSVAMLCSVVSARTISGHVYFDTAKTKPARCSEIYLWDNAGCDGAWTDMTTVDISGYYEFTGLGTSTYYSVRADWGFTSCAQCDTTGSECTNPAQSDCVPTEDDSSSADIDLVFDIDCECEGD